MKKKKTIFIIEDEPTICKLLEVALQLEGYETIVTHNGQEALEKLKTIEKPDLILLDNMMPVMSGTQFLEAIKNDHILVTIPVAMVSAYDEPSNGPSQSGTAAKTFIKKPIDFDALLTFIKEWCG
jgi:CheY-like chemotaxis protein